MKKLIVAAVVAGIASLAGVKAANAQAPARAGGYGVYPGTYGRYPSQYPNQHPTAKKWKHHNKKHERRDRDGDDDEDSRYGASGQNGPSGPSGQSGRYGRNGQYGTYDYPNSNVPQRVKPGSGYGVYNAPSRVAVPHQQAHRRDQDRRDNRGHDRDRGDR